MINDSIQKIPSLNTPEIVSEQKGMRIGERLVGQGLITMDQLNVALHEKQKNRKMLGETLVELGFLDVDILTTFLAESTGHQQFDPKKTLLDPEALELIVKKEALKHQMLPISISSEKSELSVAMADPYDVVALDKLKQVLPRGFSLNLKICSPAIIADAIHKAYGVSTSIDAILKEISGDISAAKKNIENLSEEEAYSHPIVRLVNAMVFEAVKMGASDLHFEPEE
ncbi:MAG: type II/IV secretion system protein, partial [Alphaproteobacteria bacterium]|nr:type II/IV secretion system protein [Alphaproteobacteria bacterium]